MKTKHKNCIAATATGAGNSSSEKMKSVILYPYGPLTSSGSCRMMHAKNLAITSAIYTINISLLIVLIYFWRINDNIRRAGELEDVYYGVQVAYFAIIGTQISMIILSVMLIFGIYKENPGLIVPWIIGYITFMALEAVAMVYSNVLRDHVNKQFDALCKAEVAFFIVRALVNVLAMWGVMRFYNLVRSGITWKGPEAKAATGLSASECRYCSYESRHNSKRKIRAEEYDRKVTGCCFFDFDDYDDEDDDDLADYEVDDYYDEDDEDIDSSDCSMLGRVSRANNKHHERGKQHFRPRNNNIRSVLINKRHNKYKITQPQARLEVINESERSAGSGSDENDSLLVAYDSTSSMASV